MLLSYRTYRFNTNGVKPSVSQDTLINDGGQPYASIRRIEVGGQLEGDVSGVADVEGVIDGRC
jgi:hypothetical protein